MAHFLAGALLGLSLAAPPGPVMAVLAAEAVRGRRRPALLTAFGAITGDAVWFTLVAFGFIAFLHKHPRVVGAMGLCGAALLLWMAWEAIHAARAGVGTSTLSGSWKLGFATVLTSPFSFAWWFANGAVILATWGWTGVAGLFLSLVVYSFVITFALEWVGARVKSAIAVVAYLGAVMLAGFGVWIAIASYRILRG